MDFIGKWKRQEVTAGDNMLERGMNLDTYFPSFLFMTSSSSSCLFPYGTTN